MTVIHRLSEIEGEPAKPLVALGESVGIFTMNTAVEYAAPLLSKQVSVVRLATTRETVDLHIRQLIALAIVTYCMAVYGEYQVFIEQLEDFQTFRSPNSPDALMELTGTYIGHLQKLLRAKRDWLIADNQKPAGGYLN